MVKYKMSRESRLKGWIKTYRARIIRYNNKVASCKKTIIKYQKELAQLQHKPTTVVTVADIVKAHYEYFPGTKLGPAKSRHEYPLGLYLFCKYCVGKGFKSGDIRPFTSSSDRNVVSVSVRRVNKVLYKKPGLLDSWSRYKKYLNLTLYGDNKNGRDTSLQPTELPGLG